MAAPAAPATRLDPSSTYFKSLVELSSVALGSTIESFSDDFFAEVHNMIKLGPPVDMPGQFGPNGALMDGWESRRHNRRHDCSLLLNLQDAVSLNLFFLGVSCGAESTRHFAGNECPATDVWGTTVASGQFIKNDRANAETMTLASPYQWQQILPLTPLGPAQQHFLLLPQPMGPFTHLKVTQHPDGGIDSDPIDLASILQGGRLTSTSDEHYGVGSYLLLPGRGKDREDGWHTRRSRGHLDTDRGDWLVAELGQGGGFLEWCDIDTKGFKGNFPDQVALYGCEVTKTGDSGTAKAITPSIEDDMRGWACLLDRQNVGAHAHHVRGLKEKGKRWTHVCLRIYPGQSSTAEITSPPEREKADPRLLLFASISPTDGGLKRLRLFGRTSDGSIDYASLTPMEKPV
ncbi:BQ5605_C028g10487 [Microbotryum silenes-dioicae]|uniref:BQ5605_C028g10487 protein n=1 Tax=Microbotryum silenes-dioicae TaxID=796604 RepID=A0A2X0PJK9_9BASI|nr:BQ5605_C028g10487 [Microbotryum silenes-dioicae]